MAINLPVRYAPMALLTLKRPWRWVIEKDDGSFDLSPNGFSLALPSNSAYDRWKGSGVLCPQPQPAQVPLGPLRACWKKRGCMRLLTSSSRFGGGTKWRVRLGVDRRVVSLQGIGDVAV